MLGAGERTRRGPRLDRMGGLVLAMIAGALVPPLVVSLLALRDPLPRDCNSGPVSATRLDGAILRTTGADLWYSEGFPGQPRKLLDFAPPPTRLAPGATPAARPAATTTVAPPVPSASPPTPAPPVPQVIAADIARDRHVVAFLVLDPPDRLGSVSLRLLSPLDPAGKAPAEAWFAVPDRHSELRPLVRILDNNRVLVEMGVPRAALPVPSPAVSPAPSPSPSPIPSPSPSPVPSPSAAISPAGSPPPTPGTSPSVSTPPASPSPPPGAAVAVVVDPASALVVDTAPLDFFLSLAHAGWSDTQKYRVPPVLPALAQRVDGPVARVAASVAREVGTPLAGRSLNQLVVGNAGRRDTTVVCVAPPGTSPLLFAPDESGLALFDGQETLFLDLSRTHAAASLVRGRILAWRA